MTNQVQKAQDRLARLHNKEPLDGEFRNGWIAIFGDPDRPRQEFWNQYCYQNLPNVSDVSTLVCASRTSYYNEAPDDKLGQQMLMELLEFFSPYFVDDTEYRDLDRGYAVDLEKVSPLGLGMIVLSLRNTQEHKNIPPTFYALKELGLNVPQALSLSYALRVDRKENDGFHIVRGMWHAVDNYHSVRLPVNNVLQMVDQIGLFTPKRMVGKANVGSPYWAYYGGGLEGHIREWSGAKGLDARNPHCLYNFNNAPAVNPFTGKADRHNFISTSQLKEIL